MDVPPAGLARAPEVVQIIREEMDAVGGQEMLMPVLTPFELWQQSGRDYIQEIFRLQDRSGREYVLPMTHEETVTFRAKEISSYRQLPQLLYHFSIKERDEPRCAAGPAAARFIMKDAYSFDRDEEGLAKRRSRSTRRPTTGCSSAWGSSTRPCRRVGDDGARSRSIFSRRLAPARTRSSHARTATSLPISRSPVGFHARPTSRRLTEPRGGVATPGVTTIEALAEQLGIDSAASKAMPVVTTAGKLVLGLVRGDDRLSEPKMVGVLRATTALRPTRRSGQHSAQAEDPSAP